jgi:DNA polymerase-1
MSTLDLFERVPAAPAVVAEELVPGELWVIDATALLFRAYYGMPPRSSPAGVPIGAVLGLCQLVLQIVRRNRARRIALVYDAGRETFRNRLDPRYKAQRGEPPPDLVPQFELALALGQALGFAAYSVPDFEADDLMATLAHRATAAGVGARLVSIDKDVCQLVRDAGPPIVVEDPKTGDILDEAGVRQRMGVEPARVVDAMALTGDSSDNIPGVRGVGPRAAVALIEAFGDLEGIFADLGRVEALALRGAKGLAKKLEAGRAEAFLARDLVRLCDAVPIEGVVTLPGRAAAPGGPGGLLTQTCWMGPRADAGRFFDGLGTHGPLRAFAALRTWLDQAPPTKRQVPGGEIRLQSP